MATVVMDETLHAAHMAVVMDAFSAAMREQAVDALVIQAGRTRLRFQDDQAYPFHPNPWFHWLAPAPCAPGSLFLIRNNELPELLLVMPQDFWHAPPHLPTESWTQHVRLIPVPDEESALNRALALRGRVAWLGESASPNADWLGNPLHLLRVLEQARVRKTGYELECMRAASSTGARGHMAAERAFRDGQSEFDIHLGFLAATRQNESELPYDSIVALNEHAATLHYQLRDKLPPEQHHSLLLDAGATCRGYASDITRTWAASPGPFADLLGGMEQIQQTLCEQVRSGVDWRELHLQAHRLVAGLLNQVGLLRMPAEEAVDRGVSGTFLPHGLGHLLGLQVHDVGGLRASADGDAIPRPEGHTTLRMTRHLEPGMVVTVEPGIYFIDSLLEKLRAGPHSARVDWKLVDALRPCGGIRIEDNVAVGTDAPENLTRRAFSSLA